MLFCYSSQLNEIIPDTFCTHNMHGLSWKNLSSVESKIFAQVVPPWLPLCHILSSNCINWCHWRAPIMRRCFWIDLYQFGILNTLLYRFEWIFLQFGGHLGNMQIRLWRRYFSACQHWFLDSAYQSTPNRHLKTFSSQNACTFLNKRLFLIFSLTKNSLTNTEIYMVQNSLTNIEIYMVQNSLTNTEIYMVQNSLTNTEIYMVQNSLTNIEIYMVQNSLTNTEIYMVQNSLTNIEIYMVQNSLTNIEIYMVQNSLTNTEIYMVQNSLTNTEIYMVQNSLTNTEIYMVQNSLTNTEIYMV